MQIKQEDTEIDIFVATKIGSFKHVKYHTDASKNNKKCIENLVDIKSLQKDEGITCMEWGNAEQTEILLGKKNQQIQVYSSDGTLHRTYTADHGAGHVVGVGRCRRLVSALSTGVVKIWKKKEEVLVNTGGKLDRMRVCAEEQLFATGGEENDLKIYRIGEPEPIFSAKNLAHDWLQLRRDIWVSDLCWCGQGGQLTAVCSRHGYIRLYDIRAQRRPVCNIELEKMAATCIAPGRDERQVMVGFGRGQLHAVDFRASRLDKGFKGAAGAVTAVAVSQAAVYSASLDRHLRVHCYNTKQLLYKQYLTSKLTGLLIQTEGSTPLRSASEVKEEPEDRDEMDQLFEHMDTIEEKPKKKKVLLVPTPSKKSKPSLEGSTVDLNDNNQEDDDQEVEEQEDAIKKLLRSTEKQKRRMEKKKKEKKAKSVFHNA
ncbi:WD repeat-containing protein 74 isoform X1 [Cydia pomonella]|uniref:WD repeat-containing protein 74 isoform X1 n=1 Tax=Cydia pomonella TaxID=82600 RepID=UPI002ADD49F2|nr:WD repeat-containing protein 74 isoform X1 [Cydia pomonella]